MQPDQTAFIVGILIGALVVGVLCGLLPLGVGIAKKRPVLGSVGFACCIGGGLVLGLLAALPLALIFTVIIALLPPVEPAGTRRRPRYDDDDDDDDYGKARRSDTSDGIQPDERGRYS